MPRHEAGHNPHLALLDLVLPQTDGVELMNQVHGLAEVPVIFLSEYGQGETAARVFDMGAVDYLVKPFSHTELAARVGAALRRQSAPYAAEPSAPFRLGELSINYAERKVWVAGGPVEMTPIEYGVLYELSVHAGRALTHDHLLQRVWRPEKRSEPWLVREVVKRLRRKLGDAAGSPKLILTEPRVGYSMARGETPEPD